MCNSMAQCAVGCCEQLSSHSDAGLRESVEDSVCAVPSRIDGTTYLHPEQWSVLPKCGHHGMIAMCAAIMSRKLPRNAMHGTAIMA
jgi:hypothetical protein